MRYSLRLGRLILGTLGALLASAGVTAGEPAGGVAPDDALVLLKDGNWRFVTGNAVHLQQDAFRRNFTAKNGQKPFAIILSCADSRVPPEMLFDQGLGCLFVIRVAGNVARTDEVATIEYGAGHLGARLIVVMGHTMCGAVTAVVQKAEVGPNITQLVRPIGPAVEKARLGNPGVTGGPFLEMAIRANVFQAIADLFKQSAEIRELVAEGKVEVVGAMYYLSTGEVQFLGEHPDQLSMLGHAAPGAPAAATKPAAAEPAPAAPEHPKAAAEHASAH